MDVTSQPTISRLENAVKPGDLLQMDRNRSVDRFTLGCEVFGVVEPLELRDFSSQRDIR